MFLMKAEVFSFTVQHLLSPLLDFTQTSFQKVKTTIRFLVF